MKIALVDKAPSKTDYSVFDFEYDLLHLTDERTGKKKSLVKADILLDLKELEEYDLVILVGADASKHIAKVTQVTKFAGHLVKDKYVPMVNPAMAKFKPEVQPLIDSALAKIEQYIAGTFSIKSGEYVGITRADDAIKYVDKLLRAKDLKYISVDTETSALYPRDGYVLGISLSHKQYQGVYISSDCINTTLENKLQQLFSEKVCVFHNAKFDIAMLKFHFNFKFPQWEDTMIMHYILNENEPHDLKFLALKYTELGDYDSALDTWKREYCRKNRILLKHFSYDLIPFDILSEYAAIDTDATLQLFNKFHKIISRSKGFSWLYHNFLQEALEFIMDIENNGVPFSKELLEHTQKELNVDIEEAKKALYKFKEVHTVEKQLGVIFNPNSTAHLRELLFNQLRLPNLKNTGTGQKSTDAETLEFLADKHPIAEHVLKIRKLQKIKSTYIDKIIINLDRDGRLRTGFNLTTTTSGRLSSSGKLNMQQLPRDDKRVKKCIRKEGYKIFSQDLKTAEMYYAAVLSNDQALMDVFRQGGDFHSTIAHKVFGLACEVSEVKELYPHLRQASKAISFGINGALI